MFQTSVFIQGKSYKLQNITDVGWQVVQYEVYGTLKRYIGFGFASPNITFHRPVNFILDSLPSNICIIFCISLLVANQLSLFVPRACPVNVILDRYIGQLEGIPVRA